MHPVKRFGLFILLAAGWISACKKQNGNILIDGQTDGNQLDLSQSDTFTLITNTVKEDSLPGNNLRYNLLGNLNDPILGSINVGAYAQLGLLEPNSNFPNTEEPDSAILFLPNVKEYKIFGDSNTEQGFKIYALDEAISGTQLYYQDTTLKINPTTESVYSGKIFRSVPDSLKNGKAWLKLTPGLRIKLSSAMARKLMQLPAVAYTSQDEFVKNFNGISIQSDGRSLSPGTGGLAVFDLNNAISLEYRAKILLYYRDTQTFIFTFNGLKTNITTAKAGPYPTDVLQQLNNPQQSFPLTYAQTPNGLKTHIKMPYLHNLVKDGNVAVNRAEIYLFVDKSSITPGFYVPPRLNLLQPKSANSNVNDVIEDGLSSYGGSYDAAKGYYKFIITKHIQNVLTAKATQGKDINYGLYLTVPSDQPVTGSRVVIDQTKTRLIITSTKPN